MGIGNTLSKEVQAWGSLAIVIVVVSIILLKFKDVSGVTAALNSTIDTIVSALSEPKNWVAIVNIGAIGFYMLRMFKSKSKN